MSEFSESGGEGDWGNEAAGNERVSTSQGEPAPTTKQNRETRLSASQILGPQGMSAMRGPSSEVTTKDADK